MWRKTRDENEVDDDDDDDEDFEQKHGSDPRDTDEPNQQHTLTVFLIYCQILILLKVRFFMQTPFHHLY